METRQCLAAAQRKPGSFFQKVAGSKVRSGAQAELTGVCWRRLRWDMWGQCQDLHAPRLKCVPPTWGPSTPNLKVPGHKPPNGQFCPFPGGRLLAGRCMAGPGSSSCLVCTAWPVHTKGGVPSFARSLAAPAPAPSTCWHFRDQEMEA